MGMDFPTLLDITKEKDPEGHPAAIAEVLTQEVPLLERLPFYPSNAAMGHSVTIETSLPTVGFGKINKGITQSKGSVKQVVDTIGLLEGLGSVDVRQADVIQEFQGHRKIMDRRFLRALANAAGSYAIYGDENLNANGFTGVQPRTSALQTTDYGKSYVAGHHTPGGGDTTSIFCVDLGEDGLHGIYPKALPNGSSPPGGIIAEDMGKQKVNDADGVAFFAYQTYYRWWLGLSLADPRRLARLCNIDVSQALADTSNFLVDAICAMHDAMPNQGGHRREMYCNRKILTALRKQVMAKTNLMITIEEYLGKKFMHVNGVPIMRHDGITTLEDTVS